MNLYILGLHERGLSHRLLCLQILCTREGRELERILYRLCRLILGTLGLHERGWVLYQLCLLDLYTR